MQGGRAAPITLLVSSDGVFKLETENFVHRDKLLAFVVLKCIVQFCVLKQRRRATASQHVMTRLCQLTSFACMLNIDLRLDFSFAYWGPFLAILAAPLTGLPQY